MFDDFFETAHYNHAEILSPSAWQKLAGFVHEDRFHAKPQKAVLQTIM